MMAEAQACGTPVISIDAGGALDIVENGVTGWLMRGRGVRDLQVAVRHAAREDLDAGGDPRARRALLLRGLPLRAARRGRRHDREPVPGLMRRIASALGVAPRPTRSRGRPAPPGSSPPATRSGRRSATRSRWRRRARRTRSLFVGDAAYAGTSDARRRRMLHGVAARLGRPLGPPLRGRGQPRPRQPPRPRAVARDRPGPPPGPSLLRRARLRAAARPGAGAGPRHHLGAGRRDAARLGRGVAGRDDAPPTASRSTTSRPSRSACTGATPSTRSPTSGTVSGRRWRPGA